MSQTVVSISNSLIGEFDQRLSSFFSPENAILPLCGQYDMSIVSSNKLCPCFYERNKNCGESHFFLSRNNMYFYHVVKIRASYSCLGQQENSVSLSINVCSYDIGFTFVQVQCTCYCARLQQTTNRRTISYNQNTFFLSYAKGSELNVKLVMRINFKI